MADVTITGTDILSDERYKLKQINFSIKKKDGRYEEQRREVYDHGNAAAVLLYNKETQNIILTRQFRIATFVNGNQSGMLLEVPAGLLEEGEDPADTIIREIKEETGYEVSEVHKVYEAYTSAGFITELLYLYVAEYRDDQKVAEGGGLEEESEEITVVELPFGEAIRQLEGGTFKDAKTILLLQYAMLKNLLHP